MAERPHLVMVIQSADLDSLWERSHSEPVLLFNYDPW